MSSLTVEPSSSEGKEVISARCHCVYILATCWLHLCTMQGTGNVCSVFIYVN